MTQTRIDYARAIGAGDIVEEETATLARQWLLVQACEAANGRELRRTVKRLLAAGWWAGDAEQLLSTAAAILAPADGGG